MFFMRKVKASHYSAQANIYTNLLLVAKTPFFLKYRGTFLTLLKRQNIVSFKPDTNVGRYCHCTCIYCQAFEYHLTFVKGELHYFHKIPGAII